MSATILPGRAKQQTGSRLRRRSKPLVRHATSHDGMSMCPVARSTHQCIIRRYLVHWSFDRVVARQRDDAHGVEWWPDLDQSLRALPWSDSNALFCAHERVASNMLRAVDPEPWLRRWWLQRASQTMLVAPSGGYSSAARSISFPIALMLVACFTITMFMGPHHAHPTPG